MIYRNKKTGIIRVSEHPLDEKEWELVNIQKDKRRDTAIKSEEVYKKYER